MSSLDLLPDLAARLDELVPAETVAGDWADVLRRARPRARGRLLSFRVAFAIGVLLLLAAIATATYFALNRPSDLRPRPGALTLVSGSAHIAGPDSVAQIVEVLPNRGRRVAWHCPQYVFCGHLTSVDWAPDGRRVAFTLDATAAGSAYLGLHILDLANLRETQLPAKDDRRLGCRWPTNVAWSPDGRTLAYDCDSQGRSAIFTIRRDGTGHRRLRTGLSEASSPTWAPDGTRMAFAGSAGRGSAIYVMRLDGSRRVLIGRDGSLPDWSPDGTTIAYRSPHGIELVTPAGVRVTPRAKITPKGPPAWSPDSSRLAVGTNGGVFLVDKTGRNLRRVTNDRRGVLNTVRPAWYPDKTGRRRAQAAQECGPC
jgi:Tol biopolymer transport system component